MDSNRLRYFNVVSEVGSIRKAAELLHISPAALSKAIKQLEGEVGFALVAPSGRGIIITDAGVELANRARPHIEGLDHLAGEIRTRFNDSSESTLPIKIGSFEVFTSHFLSEILFQLPEDMGIVLREQVPGEMEQALLDREIDYGITYIPIPTSGIEHHKIATIDMGIFGSQNFINKMDGVPFESIPFAIPTQPISGSPNKVQGLDGWPDDRIPRLVKYRVTLMESALEICRKGSAMAYFPTFVVRLHNDTVKSKFKLHRYQSPKGLGPNRQVVYIAKRKSASEDAQFKRLAQAVRSSCKS